MTIEMLLMNLSPSTIAAIVVDLDELADHRAIDAKRAAGVRRSVIEALRTEVMGFLVEQIGYDGAELLIEQERATRGPKA